MLKFVKYRAIVLKRGWTVKVDIMRAPFEEVTFTERGRYMSTYVRYWHVQS